ncbi:MAG: hypothetical protein NVSMB9_23770 [Isosphaeraceae bacterium]
MNSFFQTRYSYLVNAPNQNDWWHSMPLPDGSRINGANADKDLQFKIWNALQIRNLEGKSVLDIGANDGFYSLAALMSGARSVTAINSADWASYPANLSYAAKLWGVRPEIVVDDFRTHDFRRKFDVIFFFGVLYHLEDVFGCVKQLSDLLAEKGTIYMETQMSKIESDLPVFEYASDIYQTVVRQAKSGLKYVGISNYLFPNEHAIRNLAFSYDLECTSLSGPHNQYTQENPTRCLFTLVKNESGQARLSA